MSAALRRGWLLFAQVVTISAGVLIAWRAFGPVPIEVRPASVVTVREAAPPATPSTSSTRPAGMDAGFRAAARMASAAVVNVYTRKTPPQRPEGRWRPYGDSDQDPTQGQSSLGSGVIDERGQGHLLAPALPLQPDRDRHR